MNQERKRNLTSVRILESANVGATSKQKPKELTMAIETIDSILNEPKLPKAIKGLKKKRVAVPSTNDPRLELRKIVQQHRAHTKTAVSIEHMSSNRKNRETGEIIACRLAEDTQSELHAVVKSVRHKSSTLESAMLRELKKIPIYNEFFAKVFGVGPVVAAYFITEVDICKATKTSNLRRFCGMAVINGHLERRASGPKCIGGAGTYNATLRTVLFQCFTAMWKNKNKTSKARALGTTSKYLEIWQNTRERTFSHPSFDAKANTVESIDTATGTIRIQKGAAGHAFKKGWHKAADVLLEDLYIVWRTLEGLPVWPSYYAAKLGYEHGGKISVNAPKNLSLAEALQLVGNVGPVPRATAWPKKEDGVPEEIAEDLAAE